MRWLGLSLLLLAGCSSGVMLREGQVAPAWPSTVAVHRESTAPFSPPPRPTIVVLLRGFS